MSRPIAQAAAPTTGTREGSWSRQAARRAADFVQLTKPRLTSLVLATAAVGFFIASTRDADLLAGLLMIAGLAAVVGGGNALNQYWERDADARMHRTRNRPLPTGRLAAGEALGFGIAASLAGFAILALLVNALAALVALVAWGLYVLVYTPLKQRTAACTLIGAFPGAIPPLVGWAAARGSLDAGAWSLFAIIFVWQIPHFFSISRTYRSDYERGGFPMLGVHDRDGAVTGRLSLAYALLLIPLAPLPALLGLAGGGYLWGSLALGTGFAAITVWSLRTLGAGHERWVFLGSLVYLTLLMALLLVDRHPLP
jgi:protoheme IX farnesyltransferase